MWMNKRLWFCILWFVGRAQEFRGLYVCPQNSNWHCWPPERDFCGYEHNFVDWLSEGLAGWLSLGFLSFFKYFMSKKKCSLTLHPWPDKSCQLSTLASRDSVRALFRIPWICLTDFWAACNLQVSARGMFSKSQVFPKNGVLRVLARTFGKFCCQCRKCGNFRQQKLTFKLVRSLLCGNAHARYSWLLETVLRSISLLTGQQRWLLLDFLTHQSWCQNLRH